MDSSLTRTEWLRSLDWFIISALLIVIVARSSGLIGFQAQDDSNFVSFLVLCIFAAIIVDVVGSVLWMVFTISTEPFVLDPNEVPSSPFLENSPTHQKDKRRKSASMHKDNKKKEEALNAKIADGKANRKDDKKNKKSVSAPHLNRGKISTSALAASNEGAAANSSPPSSPFMKISPFNQQAEAKEDKCKKKDKEPEKEKNNIDSCGNEQGNKAADVGDTSQEGIGSLSAVNNETGPAVVLDIGCTRMRLGLAGQSRPKVMIDSAKVIDAVVAKNSAFFESSSSQQPPVLYNEDGSFGNWRLVLAVVQYLYSQGGEEFSMQRQPMLVCWSSLAPQKDAVKFASLLLKRLLVPAVYFAPAPLLALYASGRNSGCCVLSGELSTTVVCVKDGLLLEGTTQVSSVAGRFVTRNLQKRMSGGALGGQEMSLHSVREFKEKIVSCAQTRQSVKARQDVIPGAPGESEEPAASPSARGLPLSVDERQQCSEGLFRRRGSLVTGEKIVEPLQQMILASIAAVPERSTASEFWGNLVVVGGNSKLTNFKERLLSELEGVEKTLDAKDELKLVGAASGDDAEAVWLGGSVLSSNGFEDHWLYDEADVANLQL